MKRAYWRKRRRCKIKRRRREGSGGAVGRAEEGLGGREKIL